MKKAALFLYLVMALSLMSARAHFPQRLSPEEFRARQQAYLTERIGLTDEEATKFFPLYFELQDKKKEVNDEYWKLFHRDATKEMSEKEFKKFLIKNFDTRIEVAELEKTYIDKFLKVISAQKLSKLYMAEANFHREMLKGMRHKGKRNK